MNEYKIATIRLSFKNLSKNDKGNFKIYNQNCKLIEIQCPVVVLHVASHLTDDNVYEKALSIATRIMHYNKAMLDVNISKMSIELLDY